MKKNISILGLLATILLASNASSASADPTYALVDANGNVTNIIVCGSACAGGEWAGQKAVLQVAANPVTGENRGGYWQGPGTTTYNENTETFTVQYNPGSKAIENKENIEVISNTEINNDEKTKEVNVSTTTSSVILDGDIASFSFKYQDTIIDENDVESNLFIQNKFIKNWSNNTKATISVTQDQTKTILINNDGIETTKSTDTQNTTESISFDERKTSQEIQYSVTNSNLLLLNSKIQTLISLLGSWVK
jgi:hypothetical protein